MSKDADARRDRWARRLTAAAFVWSAALVVGALVAPVYHESSFTVGPGTGPGVETHSTDTLVGANGYSVLLFAALPALLTALVWLSLRHKRSLGSRSSGRVAAGLVYLLAAFTWPAMASIGAAIVPVVLLLAFAVKLTPLRAPTSLS